MRILLIISPFHPAQTPNTLRWLPILDLWSSKGHEIHVLSSMWTRDSAVDLELIDITRVGHNSLMDFWNDVIQNKRRRNTTGLKPGKQSRGKGILEKVMDYSWRKLYWPDGSMLFLRPGKKKIIQMHQRLSLDAIISVGLPYTCHLIAKHLKMYDPRVFWLMDIQDPFCYSNIFRVNNSQLYQKKNFESEKQAFNHADAVSLTNDRAFELYAQLFPGAETKMQIIPPLMHKPPAARQTIRLDKTKRHIAFFGSFYENVRSPEAFLSVLKYLHENGPENLSCFCFHFFGEQTRYSQEIFNSYPAFTQYMFHHGLMKREELYSFLEQMHAFINFGNTTDYHLPSKVVEYLYFQKPLVNFIEIEADSSLKFLDGKLAICNLMIRENTLEESARHFLEFISKPWPVSKSSLQAVEDYSPDKIAEQYGSILGL